MVAAREFGDFALLLHYSLIVCLFSFMYIFEPLAISVAIASYHVSFFGQDFP